MRNIQEPWLSSSALYKLILINPNFVLCTLFAMDKILNLCVYCVIIIKSYENVDILLKLDLTVKTTAIV